MSDNQKISASQLAKRVGKSNRDVVGALLNSGAIAREEDSWVLLEPGNALGGEYRESARFGRYIVWPVDVMDQLGGFEKIDSKPSPPQVTAEPPVEPAKPKKGPLLTSTKVGAQFELSPNRMNKLLSEIGWIEKGVKGWHVTAAGLRVGGVEKEHGSSGVPYVVWPEAVVENSVLVENVQDFTGAAADAVDAKAADSPAPAVDGPPPSIEAMQVTAFREKFEAKYRATDGHYVRSRAELAIDNWLYMTGLVHAYERKLPIEEDVYCDFYLPHGKVYIEFWGMENDPKYADRKRKKIELYRKYDYRLIELTDDDILSLDDVMPRKLLKFGIKAD